MKKIAAILSSALLLLALAVSAGASNGKRTSFSLPSQARQIAPGVYDLGTSTDKGRSVQGIAFLHPRPYVGYHHKPGHAGGPGGGGGGEEPTTTCFSYIANGSRWRETEDYLVDPTNSDGYSAGNVMNDISNAMQSWENEAGFNIFGSGSQSSGLSVDTTSTDGRNEIMFGNIAQDNVIAATVVWYTRGGPPWSRRIVEHDQIYDDTDYNWGNAGPTNENNLGDTSVMDYSNVATHELGHSVGMGHPDNTCTEETMYGFTTEGETKGRTLHSGDIEGVSALYQ